MPEGPEIRLAADKLERVLVDRPLQSVQITMPGRQHVAERLTGCAVTAIVKPGQHCFAPGFDGSHRATRQSLRDMPSTRHGNLHGPEWSVD